MSQFSDALGHMPKRTWEYGTEKVVLISFAEKTVHDRWAVLAIERLSSGNEGHVLIGGEHEVDPVIDRVMVMKFCQGGPTGGYWKIVRNATPKEAVS